MISKWTRRSASRRPNRAVHTWYTCCSKNQRKCRSRIKSSTSRISAPISFQRVIYAESHAPDHANTSWHRRCTKVCFVYPTVRLSSQVNPISNLQLRSLGINSDQRPREIFMALAFVKNCFWPITLEMSGTWFSPDSAESWESAEYSAINSFIFEDAVVQRVQEGKVRQRKMSAGRVAKGWSESLLPCINADF